MNPTAALALLTDVHELLQDMGQTHFLIDGTLLGAVREHDFIAHDTDMDIGVLAEEWDNEVIAELVRRCMHQQIVPVAMYGHPNFRAFEMALRRDNIKCDLFFYWREGDKRIFHAFKNGGRTLPDDIITYEYPAGLIETIRLMPFKGKRFPAPMHAEQVLVTKYGPDWRVPVKKWDWQYGPCNVRL